jgi:hypothetical protein
MHEADYLFVIAASDTSWSVFRCGLKRQVMSYRAACRKTIPPAEQNRQFRLQQLSTTKST